MQKKILCTICARGGSKGVKNKNIRPLLGKPLISYSIQQALRWGKAKRIIVSTDSEKIAQIARKYGAEVPFIRPARLSADKTAKLLSIRHALLKCEELFGEKYDIVLDLDVTSPLRRISDLDRCLQMFRKLRPKSLFSVVRARRNPYFNMVEKKKNGLVKLCKQSTRTVTFRQKAPEVYDMNASIYFYSRDFLLNRNNKTPISNKSAIYIMDELSSFDIDNEADFKFIEFLIKEKLWKDELL